MDDIINYQITEKIYESTNSFVYRGVLKPDNQAIILKILKENYPTPSELTRYKQEYTITRSLNSNGIIKAYGLKRYKNSLIMLLEDFGGQSLNLFKSQVQFSLEQFLTIAIQITESLSAIHTANIIHKDINPANIVYNEKTGQLKIIDFGISTRLSQENQTVSNINQLEGTLAYISPEQSGRMNRGIDYRSDFYSLGVTLYELLTHQLPFETNDPIELVHCHIAQHPKRPDELIASIPLTLTNLIIKLLAKTPEERYQSAWGIKADLETCLQQLKTTGKIAQFSLGSQDIADKFHIPQKLYGREQEITQLLATFERVSQGNTEIILVSGYSGIGKSALVNEIHKPITQQRGYFINGKFDQLQRDIPYAAITQAFQGLIRQLLSEPEITLQIWKEKILKALGNNGQIIIDVIPDLEKIIGKQSPVEQIGATESQNRFNLFFARFIHIFSQKEHPLAIFLDDLQWADLPSLNLIEKLITNADSPYLLIIGAYRDNEVSPTHPLIQTLEQIRKVEVTVNQIILQPLGISDVKQLMADTLNCSREEVQSLAELVTKKTAGNSFFITQLLQILYQEKLLVFTITQFSLNQRENNRGFWHWDIEQIQRVGITDNVVDLMVRKIEKLDENTQNILKLAACIGNEFNLEILSIVNKKSPIVTAQELQPALQEGLIIPLNNNYKLPLLWNQEEISSNTSESSLALLPQSTASIPYKFLHDRVQQAAYSLILEAEKKSVHLQIGHLLWKNAQANELDENIFNIVNQLNEGAELITKQLEKDELAKLNLQAGKKSKVSTAYAPALKYVESGLKLLASNSWDEQYNLTFEFYVEILELLCLNIKFAQFEELAEQVIKQAKSILDKSKVNQLKILYYNTTFKPDKAIDTALQTLGEFGINILPEPSKIEDKISQQQELIKLFLHDKGIENIEDLTNLPVMSDQLQIAATVILQQIIVTASTTNFPLSVEVILTQVNLYLKYGHPPEAACTYTVYGMFLSIQGDINNGDKFGKLALKLLEKFNLPRLEAFVIHVYYSQIYHWHEFLRKIVAQNQLQQSFKTGIDTGDNESASYLAIDYCYFKFLGGYNLEEVEEDFQKYSKHIKKTEFVYSIYCIDIFHKLVINLLTINNDQHGLIIGNSREEEKEYLNNWIQNNNTWLIFFAYFAKQVYFYFFKDYHQALETGFNAAKYVQACSSFLTSPYHNFYFSLAALAEYQTCDINQQIELMEQVDKNQESMKIWTNHCPANFQHKYDLVAAEKARVLGQNWQAEELYEKAIQGAKKYEFIHEEALAYERAAEFYLQLGREEIGQLYLKNAHHCYTHWGAKAKVKQLEDEYPQYFIGTINKEKAKNLSPTISTSGNDGTFLDLKTVIKASQVLAGEIVLGKLLAKLMKIVIENAGAQKGFLLLYSDDHWVIEAVGSIDSDDVTILESIPVKSLDASSQTPLLSTAIINYVARTQENVVLNDAANEGQFTRDSYIIATLPKSILCTPLLNQRKLSGILYLENNLTTGAFTPERVEVLNILSSQAAISIENSRLYTTLEQKVEERTQELSQTLDILKATQAKLEFENALLKSDEEASSYNYQVGGSLPIDAPTYVVRSADRYLYKALRNGEFCYILNTRQMGKSSLMVRMMHYLQQEGFCCAAIDMTRIGSENITPDQWYKGLAVELWQGFDLFGKVNLKAWWQENIELSPVQRLSRFFEEVLLSEVRLSDGTPAPKIVIFLDEIDCILSLDFSVNDFFALVRSCYNQRGINPEYKRLCFVLLGVATPSDLITDYRRTPFNIGQAIQLQGFQLHEAQPLLHGFSDKVSNPQAVLREVLFWTNGQPFLTQKICQMVRNSSSSISEKTEKAWIENLIRTSIIDDWETQDEPEHLRTIRDRILKGEQPATSMLEFYRQVLENGNVKAADSPIERELILSGLLVKEESCLKIHNRIYEVVFDNSWILQNI
ncbi:AAA family ATPase [Anabaena cylindrica FACHB-243]|uniref:Serine/threonine protein kinase n=1 Tax=Anabaena cylindrica (strain ATCC 27899 / PCC 7122) TaxID=272123 RepID=K9ZB68_ANACC|nr:AAA family ATPase [Anabaena cylindrica]AFZ55979.1 serine/threonine protein kinase [Anabaena cylindrica PCC 7122]MBD2421399.1 AAA family ATPase [Anabaena cylindrica FACHB-243]BAY01593.1 serine/threonine protein kinase [Anabaena cylindrica PCC 7122]